jgi:hypothetical protein
MRKVSLLALLGVQTIGTSLLPTSIQALLKHWISIRLTLISLRRSPPSITRRGIGTKGRPQTMLHVFPFVTI